MRLTLAALAAFAFAGSAVAAPAVKFSFNPAAAVHAPPSSLPRPSHNVDGPPCGVRLIRDANGHGTHVGTQVPCH